MSALAEIRSRTCCQLDEKMKELDAAAPEPQARR